jgi:acyl-CoA dehydrogenase
VMSNFSRCLVHGLTRGRLLPAPQHGIAGHYYRQFGRMSLAFAVTTEMALISLGGTLKRRESLSGRLGDVLSQLYLGSAVLKQYYEQGSPEEDLRLLEYACEELLCSIQSRLYEILDNFPSRFVARLTRLLTFPAGKVYRRPLDELSHRVTGLILRPGHVRDRLTQGVYIPDDNTQPLAQLEDALEKSVAAESALLKLRDAMRSGALPHGDPEHCADEGVRAGIITGQEAAGIRAAIAARQLVIQVDDFDPQYLGKERDTWGDSKPAGVAGQSL